MGHLRKAELDSVCRKKSGQASGTKRYIGAYQHALKDYVDDMPAEEKEQYKEMAKEWNEDHPPVELQRK